MKKIFYLLYFIFGLFSAQINDFNKLENEVYDNNRNGKHHLSQTKLLQLLSEEDLSYRDQVKVNLLLATTFRSINDYGTAISYLEKSSELAENLNADDSLKASINAELAFVYFDDQNYKKSENLIKKIALSNYLNVNENDKAYIIMQHGYIHYLDKKYDKAVKDYENALNILSKFSPCNQPAVLVKQMQLYATLNDLVRVKEIYKKCMTIADSCKIIKYKIYATEEIRSIFKRNDSKDETFYYSTILDSLNLIYDRESKLSGMHVTNEKFLEKKNEGNENNFLRTLFISIFIILLLGGISFYFYQKSTYQKNKYEQELFEMKKTLESYSQRTNSEGKVKLENEDLLSARQKELLDLMAEGLSNKEIAEKLFISENTVKFHIKNIYNILDLKSRKDLLLKFKGK